MSLGAGAGVEDDGLDPGASPSLITLATRRLRGEYRIDEWGVDPELVDLIHPVVGMFLHAEIDGAENIPRDGPAVLVANRRVGAVEPLAIQRAVRLSTARRVRFLGIPDIAPIGSTLRRLGGAVNSPGELAALLRAGHLVTVPLGRTWRKPLRAGSLPPEALAPVLMLGVPVIPVAVIGGELTGRWRVIVGEPVESPHGRSPLALAELTDSTRNGVQALLDEAFPPRWLLG